MCSSSSLVEAVESVVVEAVDCCRLLCALVLLKLLLLLKLLIVVGYICSRDQVLLKLLKAVESVVEAVIVIRLL